MARRGNQQKNWVDRRTSKHASRISESVFANPASTGQEKACDVKVSPGDSLPNGLHPTPGGSSTSDVEITSHSLGSRESHQHSRTFQSKQDQGMDVIREIEELVSSESNPNHYTTSSLEPPGAGEGSDILHENLSSQKNTTNRLDYLLNHLHLTSILMVRNLRTLYLYSLKMSGEWLERQRPSLVALTNNLDVARDFVKLTIRRAYPVLLKWLAHFGNIILLLSMIWLDCALRGIGSFLHMGTTSFFSVIWLSIFSVIAMVGMLKFLIVLAIAAFVGVFGGLTLGLSVVAIAGIIFLWFYGSFWTTTLVVLVAGLVFMLSRERLMLLISTGYSLYCAWTYVGWLGVIVALNLSFFSSDILVYFLSNMVHQHQRSSGPAEQFTGVKGQPGFFRAEPSHATSSETGQGFSSNRGPGIPSTSEVESELTSEDEVLRLLSCSDHYQVLGLSRYDNVDISFLKKEYRKKAMLVHPDKNMGNEKAADAFKKLQNAYEVLLDSLKRKAYDDELRREELLNYFRRFQSTTQKIYALLVVLHSDMNDSQNGEHGIFSSGLACSEGDGEDPFGDSRQIACERCSGFHIWVHTKKPKSRARWCQDCNDFHQAKDGDGWVEQFSQPFLFGIFQKVDDPSAYVCADSKIYDVTEWFVCQKMRCPANTHKPSFHVNATVSSRHSSSTSKRSNSGQRGGKMPKANEEGAMNSEELFEWFQNAMRSGMFDNFSAASADRPTAEAGGNAPNSGGGSSSKKKKKKGKKQW